METTLAFILTALQYGATVYGMDELKCGDYDQTPVACAEGATTASGEPFKPEDITAAVPMPRNRIIKPTVVRIKIEGGQCVAVRVTDKKHERYVNRGGLDLSVGAVKALTKKKPRRSWGGKIYLCKEDMI